MRLNRSKFKKKLEERLGYTPESRMVDYLFNQNYRNEVKIPKNTINHVGIEVECYSKVQWNTLSKMIYTEDLENYINISDDGSIRNPDGYNSYELRILIPEHELVEVFERITRLFRTAEIKTNDSCGLHVHLDMRNREFKKSFNRLVSFQDVLFGVVNKNRWNNRFCLYTVDSPLNGRYRAINKHSYLRHKTIEVRLHHGTADTKKILKWINLLLVAVNSKTEIPKFKTKRDILKWKELKGNNLSYVRKNFNPDWFEFKPSALLRAASVTRLGR